MEPFRFLVAGCRICKEEGHVSYACFHHAGKVLTVFFSLLENALKKASARRAASSAAKRGTTRPIAPTKRRQERMAMEPKKAASSAAVIVSPRPGTINDDIILPFI